MRVILLLSALAGSALGQGVMLQPKRKLNPSRNRPSPREAAANARKYAEELRLQRDEANRGAYARAADAEADHEAREEDPDAPARSHQQPEPVEILAPIHVETIVPHLSFTGPYSQYKRGIIPGWIYGGEASLTNDYLQVTPYIHDKLGWVWTEEPTALSEWQAELDFYIGGKKGRGAGGGMSFWFTSQQGRSGPIYGHGEHFEGVGILFDTYENQNENSSFREPFIAAIFNSGSKTAGDPVHDPSNPIDSIMEAHETDYFKSQAGICIAHYRNLERVAKARIIWQGGRLSVWLDLDSSGQYQNCLHTAVGDKRVKLPKEGYFGVTAATAVNADTHVAYQLRIASLEGAPPVAHFPYQGPELRHRHMVHQEDPNKDKVHHVKLGSRAGHSDGAKTGEQLPGADGDVETAHETQLPPQQSEQDYLGKFSSELASIEMALWDISMSKNVTENTIALVHETLTSVVAAPVEEILKSVDPLEDNLRLLLAQQHATVLDALAELDKKIDGGSSVSDGRALSSGDAVAAPPPAAVAAAAAELPHNLRTMPDTMVTGFSGLSDELRGIKGQGTKQQEWQARVTAKLDALSGAVEGLKATPARLEGKVHELSTKIDRLTHLVEKGGGSSGGGWVLPIFICAQTLVLAAFLFYKMNDRKRGHLL